MVFRVMILDSSFLVSLYRTEDGNNPKALEFLRQNKEEELLLCDLVLFETLTVLNYKGGISLAKEAYNDLIANMKIQILHLNETETSEILGEFFSQKTEISFEDASVVHLARKTGSKVLAFDRKIISLAGKKR